MYGSFGFSSWKCASAMLAMFVFAGTASATRFSDSGTLSDPEEDVLITLHLNLGGSVDLQTYGFGGGIDFAGHRIESGGFDAYVGIFSGTGPDALFINGTSDILSNYSPGCPPAGTLTIGSVTGQCGDDDLVIEGLTAGTYTILLSDGGYIPEAEFESGPGYLGDGFVDLTGGAFQTCYDANDCNNDTGNWALDITAPEGASLVTTPEPNPFRLSALALAFAMVVKLSKRKSKLKQIEKPESIRGDADLS